MLNKEQIQARIDTYRSLIQRLSARLHAFCASDMRIDEVAAKKLVDDINEYKFRLRSYEDVLYEDPGTSLLVQIESPYLTRED